MLPRFLLLSQFGSCLSGLFGTFVFEFKKGFVDCLVSCKSFGCYECKIGLLM